MNVAIGSFAKQLQYIVDVTYVNGEYWLPFAHQMVTWCEKNCTGEWSHKTVGTFPTTTLLFLFANATDAAHFKLVWA